MTTDPSPPDTRQEQQPRADAPPDLVERLSKATDLRKGCQRLYNDGPGPCKGDMWFFELWHFLGDVEKAAAAIARLRAELDQARGVLKGIADAATGESSLKGYQNALDWIAKRARAALKPERQPE